ncbi:MAG: hypothetical protein OXF02_01265 [Simkaniaceae bacterium]|nr:hypothetical protein [Simkaniaceae bacterium]
MVHHTGGGSVEATALARSNFKERLPTNLQPEAIPTTKDEYALVFRPPLSRIALKRSFSDLRVVPMLQTNCFADPEVLIAVL